ncbi:cysteine dioxygenase [Nostoc sphaeroides]|uniref:Cysteine dioxygenase n=1 Tax=Nostoc sphaeroides CCNUC1 TaxID=2653204 RepID=A0A5P8WIE7_9NOSO|nr:cysteine dioxygenase family protein [Nostoc sphaeroides]QFS51589.1 hypothetical protein GXM_09083 [Nostoc sphaeroides CCNUC1]
MVLKSQHIRQVPKFKKGEQLLQNQQLPIQLLVDGQGTVFVNLNEIKPFSIILSTDTNPKSTGHGFELTIDESSAIFYQWDNGDRKKISCDLNVESALDKDNNCIYWLSLNTHNPERNLRYGKGEMRFKTQLTKVSILDQDEFKWIHNIKYVIFLGSINQESVQIWRDPVTIEPAIIVISNDEITMEFVANYEFTISANLTPECQKLYANIAGKEFILDTDDFPNFSEAIKRSINNPNGWCYKKLKEKSEEFGKKDEAATYLRITLGINQGDSPGVPYVMEIWPGGHYSPIHNHARANAIIRVLHGEIVVSLYSMLSLVATHQKPFSEQRLKQGEITWIAPELNQTHKLYNPNGKDSPCITIQCYLYSDKDNSHYEYFDYINNDGTEICQFDPVSDMDFLEFKNLMKEEWHNLHNI